MSLAEGVFTLRYDRTVNPFTPRYVVEYRYVGEVPAGAPAVPASASYGRSARVTVAAAPAMEGYAFSGWSTDDADVQGGSFLMPGNTVVLEGSWTPVDPVDPPVDPVDPPPVDPVDPPVDPVDPPVDPVDPPVDPVDPPVDPVDPPVDPVDPPVDPVIDIPDDDVPLVDVPETGDMLMLWIAAAVSSLLGLVWLTISDRKRRAA